ncbi:MAG: SRPBCC family protein [Nitriliruptorales bacterium]|nr:SRPBCC family protein [Nitriliruptorales bacterium]
MPVIERSAVVPLPPEDAWEAFFGDEMQNWVRLSDLVVEVREYELRPDGTPEYVMVNRAGPMKVSHRSDYVVYDPPRRAEDDTLDSALGGRWVSLHEPVDGGTKVTHRWNVEPHGVMKLLFPLVRRGMEKAFQADLDQMADRIRQVR